MIIDGKLIVSKKKKRDLVAELKQKGFKAFSKTIDASKDGENEPVVENDEVDEDENVEVEANSYDYLLGMAIWSLTKERVEKLLRQIGDKELEIDALIKLSKEDLWKKDLEDFINEWRFQLEDEEKRQRKVASMGRRVSSKLKTQVKPTSKKRKGDDSFSESDFAGKKQRKVPAVIKKVQPKGGMLAHLSPPAKPKQTTLTSIPNGIKVLSAAPSATEPKGADKADKDVWLTVDGAEDSDVPIAPVAAKGKAAAATKKAPTSKAAKPTVIDSDSDEEPVVKAAPASRAPRTAARKPVKYSLNSDSDNGDDMLFDVGKMVKGIGSTTVPLAAGPSTTRPLFSTTASLSRPGSSAGLVARKSLARTVIESGSEDETDYTRLAPATSGGVKATARATLLSDDDEDDDVMDDSVTKPASPVKPAAAVPKPRAKAPVKAPAAKPAPKAVPAAKQKEQKKLALSPAAKAYAAKQSKANAATSTTAAAGKGKPKAKSQSVSSDEEDDDDLDDLKGVGVGLGREASVAASEVGGRPARRAAAVAVKKTWVIDEDDEEEDDEEEDAVVASEESEDFDESE
jgi:DNA topoisomerase-2